jgi:ABC-type multidrug transport system fused ATPase/permease subunit
MNKIMFRTLLSICKEYHWALAFFLTAGISQTFVGLFAISYFQRLIDGLTRARQFNDVLGVIVWYVSLTLLNHMLIYLQGYPSSLLNNGAYQWAKLSAMKKVARIDYLAHQNLGTGQLLQVIENGANAIKSILNNFYLNLVRGMLPTVIVSFAFISYYDPTLLAIILVAYAILFFASYYLMNYLRRAVDRMLTNQEDFSKFSTRGFMELVVFRINNRFHKEFARLKSLSDEYIRSRAKIYLVQELFFTGFAALVFVLEVIIIVQQTNRILTGVSTVGTLVALVAFIKTVCSPIAEFSYAYTTYKLDTVAFNHFGEFLSLPEDAGLDKDKLIQLNQGHIEFRNISFSFQNKPVLSNFSLTLDGGKTTALVGTSGSGKSTLVKLLLQLLKSESGQIFVDGQNLSQVNLESFYRQVAYIPQEPPIFDGSLRENLTFNEQCDDAYIHEVLRKVDLDSLVNQLPTGLETVVGERGIKLSGGERQRLAFGRAFIQNPGIILMDEPTSSLDSITEKFVTQNMTHLFNGKTVVIIAHRLQTVKNADKIVVIENGQVVQQGIFDDLVTTQGKFQELWQAQTTISQKENQSMFMPDVDTLTA